jgi:uncharacterized double-CXXCG motif protein
MNFFIIGPDKNNWGKIYNDDIIVRRAWCLPGVRCSECGNTWAMIGVDYPLVDLSFLPADILLSYKPRAVSVEEYIQLRNEVTPLVSKEQPLPPGTGFGPLSGKGVGKCGDFAWPNSWTLLVKRKTYLSLQSSNLRLSGVSVPQLKVKEKSECDLFEFQIEPRVNLAPASYTIPEPRICPKCGRDDRKVVKLVIDRNTIPSNLDMMRIVNYPTYIIVSERFRDTANQLNLSNICFDDVEV